MHKGVYFVIGLFCTLCKALSASTFQAPPTSALQVPPRCSNKFLPFFLLTPLKLWRLKAMQPKPWSHWFSIIGNGREHKHERRVIRMREGGGLVGRRVVGRSSPKKKMVSRVAGKKN